MSGTNRVSSSALLAVIAVFTVTMPVGPVAAQISDYDAARGQAAARCYPDTVVARKTVNIRSLTYQSVVGKVHRGDRLIRAGKGDEGYYHVLFTDGQVRAISKREDLTGLLEGAPIPPSVETGTIDESWIADLRELPAEVEAMAFIGMALLVVTGLGIWRNQRDARERLKRRSAASAEEAGRSGLRA